MILAKPLILLSSFVQSHLYAKEKKNQIRLSSNSYTILGANRRADAMLWYVCTIIRKKGTAAQGV